MKPCFRKAIESIKVNSKSSRKFRQDTTVSSSNYGQKINHFIYVLAKDLRKLCWRLFYIVCIYFWRFLKSSLFIVNAYTSCLTLLKKLFLCLFSFPQKPITFSSKFYLYPGWLPINERQWKLKKAWTLKIKLSLSPPQTKDAATSRPTEHRHELQTWGRSCTLIKKLFPSCNLRQKLFPPCKLFPSWYRREKLFPSCSLLKVVSRHARLAKNISVMHSYKKSCFRHALLFKRCFRHAFLRKSCYRHALLYKCCFRHAILRKSCFRQALFEKVKVASVFPVSWNNFLHNVRKNPCLNFVLLHI